MDKNKLIVFFNVPTMGHMAPSLALASGLILSGHTVIFISDDSVKELILSVGAIYVKNPDTLNILYPALTSPNPPSFSEMSCILLETAINVLPSLIEICEKMEKKPDIIVSDTFSLWGTIIANHFGLKSVILHATFAFSNSFIPPFSTFFLALIDKKSIKNAIIDSFWRFKNLSKTLKNIYKIEIRTIWEILQLKANCQIVFIPREFQIKSHVFDSTYHFVGAPFEYSRNPKLEKTHKNNVPFIYISLGTVFNNNLTFFKNCISAFKDQKFNVVISIGKHIDVVKLGSIPENIQIHSYVNQKELLLEADLFVSHSGMNSVSEAILANTCMLLCPQSPEQNIIAKQVVKFGAGLILKINNPNQILLSVKELVSNPNYKIGMANLAEMHKKAGGYNRIEELINSL